MLETRLYQFEFFEVEDRLILKGKVWNHPTLRNDSYIYLSDFKGCDKKQETITVGNQEYLLVTGSTSFHSFCHLQDTLDKVESIINEK